MARSNGGKAKAFFRANPSGAFDQYLQDIQKLPLIKDPAEERRLARRVQRGDEKAAERLVTANLRFVISYVKKYQGHGLDLSELVAIGNEGLLKAVKKFDPDQGVKFISYAVWWVRQAVLKALAEQTRSVRIPLNQNSQLIRMSRTETYLSQELGREPTDDEIALALEDTVENVRTARRMTAAELSLDAPVDRTDKDAATLGERFAGQEGGEIEEKTDGKLMREFIDRIFQKYLTPRERKILYLYYGLAAFFEAVIEVEDLPLAGGEVFLEDAVDELTHQLAVGLLLDLAALLAGEPLAQRGGVLVGAIHGGVERQLGGRHAARGADVFNGVFEGQGDFVVGGFATELLRQVCLGAAHADQLRVLVQRDADAAGLLGQRLQHRLPHPPHRVRDELHTLVGIELLHRLEQPFVSDGDQLGEIETVTLILLDVGDDESEVGCHQALGGFFIAPLHPPRQPALLGGVFDQGQLLDVLEVLVEGAGRIGTKERLRLTSVRPRHS